MHRICQMRMSCCTFPQEFRDPSLASDRVTRVPLLENRAPVCWGGLIGQILLLTDIMKRDEEIRKEVR